MYQNKIEKFTDKLLSKSKSTRLKRKNFNLCSGTNSARVQVEGDFHQMKYQSNRERFRSQKKQLGLSRTDIDKLQLMCADLTAEDYLYKLIQIHQQEKFMIGQADLLPFPKPQNKVQEIVVSVKQEKNNDHPMKPHQINLDDGKQVNKEKFKRTFRSRKQQKGKNNHRSLSIQQSKNINYFKDQLILDQQQVHKGKELQQICYAQIGKRMVIVTQKQIRRQFFQTNLHIRAYLMRNIVQYIKYIAQFSPYSIFILPNERALHFQPNEKPQQLTPYLEHTKYVQIIRNVNHIIQKNIFKQKYQEQAKDYWPYAMLGILSLIVIMIMIMAFVGHVEGSSNQLETKDIIMIFTGLLICIFLVILIGYSLHCYAAKIKFRPVCEKVYEDIDSYFKYINGKMENNLQWIIGESFFWVEVRIHPYCRSKGKDEDFQLIKKKNKNGYYLQYLEDQINASIRQ